MAKYNHKHNWTEIINGQYQFERKANEIEHLKTLTKDDVYKFYKRCIAEDSPWRRKLSVYVIGNDKTATGVQQTTRVREIFDVNDLTVVEVKRPELGKSLI